MRKISIIFSAALLLVATSGFSADKQPLIKQLPKDAVNFIVANDLGRNGYYLQKPIAELMGSVAEQVDIEMVAAAGDVHHFDGVASTADPLWNTNFEYIYSHPELMIEWNAIAGNHEYRGSTQAVLDYTKVSRRWNAPAKYYTKTVEVSDSITCKVVFIDTTPLMDKYRNSPEEYPDARLQDMDKQLKWIDSVLLNSTEKWKIVIGHHPVYAETKKDNSERADMQSRLAPILERNGVDAYINGHIHNFQHIKPKAAKVNYITNSSASLARTVKPIEGTQFCSPEAGFTICSATDNTFGIYFINPKGEVIYNYVISK